MKINVSLYFIFLFFWTDMIICQENVQIAPSTKNDIVKILGKPYMVYKLDLQGNTDNFFQIDSWFMKNFSFKKAETKQYQNGENISYKLMYKKNTAISPFDFKVEGIKVNKPFYARYEKEFQRRIYIKEIKIPTTKHLKDEEVKKIGNDFIVNNKFCKITKLDKLSESNVSSLKKQTFERDSLKKEELIVFYRVEFKRKFSGLEVKNSKQVVDIHPESLELLSYENINWTPVDENSGKLYSYLSLDEVIAKIDSNLSYSGVKYIVTKVQAAMYQNEEYIFPVLVVYSERLQDEMGNFPPKQVLIINLAKGLNIEKKVESKLKIKPEEQKKTY